MMAKEISDSTLYRFRPIHNLLDGYHELEDQSIFFASPELLNDPAEGFRDIYFKGDFVLWKNLFKNYLLCAVDVALSYFYYGESKEIESDIATLATENDIPFELKDVWSAICNVFFENEFIVLLLNNIVKYRDNVSQYELSYYLSYLHPIALNCIFEQFNKSGIIRFNTSSVTKIEEKNLLNDAFFKSLNDMFDKNSEELVDEIFINHQFHTQQFFLVHEHKNNIKLSNKKLLLSGLPFLYIRKIEQFMYPSWFTACFMSSATNSSVWGNYGENHTGVCLIYNTELNNQNEHCLKLNNYIVGYSSSSDGPILGAVQFKFHGVRYTHKQEQLNFFESLGSLPIPTVNDQWLTDDNGRCSDNFLTFNSDWRNKYWNGFYPSITQKTRDWVYENEHRLIINNMSGNYSPPGVVLNYDFKSLKGIIFGIKTKDEDKLKIIEIVKRKIHENNHHEFRFYQAYYCRHSGEIKSRELELLTFSR